MKRSDFDALLTLTGGDHAVLSPKCHPSSTFAAIYFRDGAVMVLYCTTCKAPAVKLAITEVEPPDPSKDAVRKLIPEA